MWGSSGVVESDVDGQWKCCWAVVLLGSGVVGRVAVGGQWWAVCCWAVVLLGSVGQWCCWAVKIVVGQCCWAVVLLGSVLLGSGVGAVYC
jgi:hypothetical protein